jgi:MYXO-CTERM domain-containing protein
MRWLVAVAPLSWASLAPALPNESCAGAVALGVPASISVSTLEVADSTSSSGCGKEDRFAVWYSFTAPDTRRYRFDTQGQTDLTDTTLEVYETCGGNALVCIDDTTTSISSAVELDLVAGQKMVLRAAGWGESKGELTLSVNFPEALDAPANDLCVNAAVLDDDPGGAHGNTLHSTGSDVTSCGTSDSNDIWYSFTASETKTYDFYVTQNMITGNFVSVHGACGADELACGLLGTSAALVAGQTVFVRVGTDPNAADQFNLHVGPLGPAIQPENDAPSGAKPLGLETVTASTLGATKDALNFGPTCGPFVNAVVWYSFTAPEDGSFVFDTSQSALEDTILGVFGPCDGPLPLLGCDNDSGAGKRARIDGLLAQGESVCIAVGGNLLSEVGDFTLTAQKLPAHPPNDECDQAGPLSGFPVTVSGENYASRPETLTSACPSGEFALWYSFVAPEDGWYKFDTKQSTETSPDIALYSACGDEPIACSGDPLPVVTREMTAGESVLVRLATNVFLRSEMVLHVGPAREDTPSSGGSAGATGGAGGSAPLGGSAGVGTGGASGPRADGVAEGGGCGCRLGGAPLGKLSVALTALALFVLRRRKR